MAVSNRSGKRINKLQSRVELLALAVIVFSVVLTIFFLNSENELNTSSYKLIRYVSFYPEQIVIGGIQDVFRDIVASTNISCLIFMSLYRYVHRAEIVEDKYERQDRKNALLLIAGFFFVLRIGMLIAFASERGPVPEGGHLPLGSNPYGCFGFPAINIICLSCVMLSFGIKSGQGDNHGC